MKFLALEALEPERLANDDEIVMVRLDVEMTAGEARRVVAPLLFGDIVITKAPPGPAPPEDPQQSLFPIDASPEGLAGMNALLKGKP